MRKLLSRFELITAAAFILVLLVIVFHPYLFQKKILFPSNLLVSTYNPWRYEPVPEYPNGPANKPMGFDDIRQFLPNRKILKEEVSKFQIPLWNPYIYSGAPFMGAFDTAVWYPLSWIASALPLISGWDFLVIIQPLLSFLFMYVFLRSLKLDMRLSLYGAFAYTFSGWMIVYWQEILVLEHSFLWLPLALYASNRLWDKTKDKIGMVLLICAFACSVLAGFMQMAIYVYLVVVAWNVFRYITFPKTKERRSAAQYFIYAVIISLLITAVQCIPSIEAFFLSPRGTDAGAKVFSENLLPLHYLFTLLAPDFWGTPATYSYFGGNGFYFEKMIFIGIIPLIFALYGMFQGKTKSILFWTILALTALSLGFALPTSWLPYHLRIPVLSNSYPTRIFAVWAFSSIVLSCFGLQAFLKHPNRRRMAVILVGCSLALAVAWAFVLLCRWKIPLIWNFISTPSIKKYEASYIAVSLRNLIIPTAFLFSGWCFLILSRFSEKIALTILYGAIILSGLYFAQKYVYFSEFRFVYPDLSVTDKLTELSVNYDRIWGYGHAFIEKNLPQYYRWFSTDGYGNLSSKRYADLLSTIVNNGKLGGEVRRSDTDIYEASEWDPFASANPYRLRMMSLLSVKYVLESKIGELKDKIPMEKRFDSAVFSLVWQDPIWRIWEFKKALPRVVYADSYVVRKEDQAIIDALYDPNIDLSATVILETEPDTTLKGNSQGTSVTRAIITKYAMNSVEISTQSDSDGFILLTDNSYPGWHATIDGNTTKIYRANYAFKAVYVPCGQHVVVFRYFPLSVMIGIGLTAIGMLLCIMFWFKK
jgi:hypothetical protein